MKNLTTSKTLLSSTIAILMVAVVVTPHRAAAQETKADADQEKDQQQIEVIMVTAQKRVQSINDIGVAITAFNGDDVKELGLTQPIDLAAQTPNLNINNTFSNSIPNVSIRGIGLNDYAVNNNPAAGLYVDEVYLSSPAMLSFQLFDLERIEVLKGPQGTLYGRNTTAGTVTFVSNKPNDITEGYLSIDYASFDRLTLEGAITGELTSGLTGRVALQSTQQKEGHQTNRATGQDVGKVDLTAWRAMLNWQPSDELDILLNIHRGRDKSDTWLVKVDNAFTAADDQYFPGDPYDSSGHSDTQVDITSEGAALSINWDLSQDITLTSVTGYEQYQRRHVEDRDGSALIQLDGEFNNEIEQLPQELRLTYVSQELVLIGGVFYGKDEIATRDRFDTSDLPFPFKAVGNEYKQHASTKGLFVHSEYKIAEHYKLTTGLRYTDEKKQFFDAFTFIYPAATPLQGGTQVNVFTPVNNTYKINDVSGKIGIDYSGLDNTLVYASISKGFKSGNFQGQLTFNPADLEAFDEEEVIAYEVGFKSQLLGNTLQLNGAAFFYDYSDMQIYGPIFYSEEIKSNLFGIANVGDARIKGLELDLMWLAAEGLDVRLGLGLLDTEVTKSVVPGIKKGSELANSPKVNLNANIRYNWQLNDNMNASISFNSSYKGKVAYDIVNQPKETREGGYALHNLRVGISSLDDVWSVYLYGKNLSDNRYRTQVLTSTVGYGETYGMPRTFGIALNYCSVGNYEHVFSSVFPHK